MGETTLKHPDNIFNVAPPPPPPWLTDAPFPHIPTLRSSPSIQWNEFSTQRKTLRWTLSKLQNSLRSLHKRKILWPVERYDSSSNLTPIEYLMMLLQPIPTIFNQLNPSNYFKTPMKCLLVNLGHSIHGATFEFEELKLWRLVAPIVIALPGDLFSSTGQIHSNVESALLLAMEHSPKATVIITNFADIAIFLPSNYRRPEPTFERVSTTQPSLALRVLATAYLLVIDTRARLLYLPDPDWNPGQDVANLQGPPQDPTQLLPDAEVFATHHCQSDFDMVTLVRDPARALQFFRWHEYVAKNVSKVVTHPHDTLTAKTNDVGQFHPGIHPVYPFDTSEVPPDTAAHLEAIQRKSPLVAAGVDTLLERSKTFTIEIQDVIDEGSEGGMCTVYRCQINTIDNIPVSTPSLCLKLFDDRFQNLQSPEDDESDDDDLSGDELDDVQANTVHVNGVKLQNFQPEGVELNGIQLITVQFDSDQFENSIHTWLAPVVFAEKYALNEAFAYDKLRSVQGSVVPWFYGVHPFTLPDGTVLYGILMELIEGWKLETSLTRELSPERQINMIQSCRHAVRILDAADISQRDWHSEQLLLCTNPETQVDHVVLLDFASTLQTWDPDEPIFLMNYFHMFRILLHTKDDQRHAGFSRELVLEHFGEPDDWDPVNGWVQEKSVQARDIFDYITSP
ncbi:hypothetical protein F5878DRAFT_723879 [Lentinula raphanica]|uniref:Protein kinase domain-containing protein n=1 Tax=Lentinula raphanica TaxID=153919 RepID=A0AA38PCS5_9AGAR|nr:hypothetical protein F5880DRAFT_1551096 [Lentinula raphanica]KAJ3840310.1 hypothetical protein F5878DRAFT_723879 [Lentinula raphanica]